MAETHTLGTSPQEPHRRRRLPLRFDHWKAGVIHASFWTLAYFILLALFAGSSEWQPIDHIYTLLFMSTLIMAVLVNSLMLIPRLLLKGKYFFYVVTMLVNIAVLTGFNFILFDKLIDFLLPGYYFISYYDYFDLLKFFGSFIILTTLIQLAMDWFKLQETRQAVILLEKAKVDAELQALTNQVNPHFLFNSLSVLYSLALRESKDAPGAIMQLSDILRYVIYDSNHNTVALSSEIDLINNYIGLQRYRVHGSTKIDFHVEVSNPTVRVMPMTFLPLLENSFKHGVHSEAGNAFVNIVLHADDETIRFSITNSRIPAALNTPGIGLKNIESRLKLVYPGHHNFKITETENTFKADVELPARR